MTKKVGGEFVKTGTYGCVFRPPLKCKDATLNAKYSKGYISKLMKKIDAVDEINEVITISEVLEQKGDDWVKKYFVLPTSDDACIIDINDETNIKDIKESNEKKGARTKCKISLNNISQKENDFSSLNMVDGGIDLDDFLEKKGTITDQDFTILNKKLIDLLVTGIYEMNNLGIYHFDIKASNIVYNEKDGRIRLIDWGFAKHINKNEITKEWLDEKIADYWKTGSSSINDVLGTLYYGAHYGNALLPYDFATGEYNLKDLVKKKGPIIFNKLGALNTDYFQDLEWFIKKKFKTHYLMATLTINDILIKNYKAIIKQSRLDYFKNVYLPNSDIFAFLLVYLKIYDYVASGVIRQNIVNLINRYVISDKYSKQRYSMLHIWNDLQKLSKTTASPPRTVKHSPSRTVKHSPPRTVERPLSPRTAATPPLVSSLSQLQDIKSGGKGLSRTRKRSLRKRRKTKRGKKTKSVPKKRRRSKTHR